MFVCVSVCVCVCVRVMSGIRAYVAVDERDYVCYIFVLFIVTMFVRFLFWYVAVDERDNVGCYIFVLFLIIIFFTCDFLLFYPRRGCCR